MRFTSAVLAALSIVASQAVILTNSDFSGITVDKPFEITYSGAVGPVTLYYGNGTPADLKTVDTIGTSSGSSGSITWRARASGNFAFKIVDANGDVNYSSFFTVAGPAISSPTSTPGVSTTKPSTSVTTPTSVVPPVNNTTTIVTSTTARTNGTSTVTGTGSSRTNTATGTSTSVPTQIPNSVPASFASPLAFVLLAMGALLTLN